MISNKDDIEKTALDRLENIDKIANDLQDGNIFKERKKYAELSKEYSKLIKLKESLADFSNIRESISELKVMIEEESGEMKEMAIEELSEKEREFEDVSKEISSILFGPEEDDSTPVLIEIKSGTGGEESALFCRDLVRMYSLFSEQKGLKFETLDKSESISGGYKEVVIRVSGKNSYRLFRFESGGHRVQRVPLTESQGRVHTSMVTISVIPEAKDEDVEINNADLSIETFRSGGAGGQHVNTTDSAVRITHIPTGVVVKCEDERSQHSNKEKAMRVLNSKIKASLLEKRAKEERDEKIAQSGSGERNERIRTYNFPQNRMTDHRINKAWYNLDRIMMGDLDDVFKSMIFNAG